MSRAGHFIVIDGEGVRGTFAALPSHDEMAAGAHVTVDLGRGGRGLKVPARALVEQEDGTFFYPGRFAGLEGAGRNHEASAAGSRPSSLVVPVLEEELQVGRREVEAGRVRFTKRVLEDEVVVDDPVVREEVEVVRVAVGRQVDAPPPAREEGDTLIIPVLEEVLVVEKRLVLVEELHVRKRRVEERRPQSFTLRKEEIVAERVGGQDQQREDDEGRPTSAAQSG
jgi:uncharacterized protein (TIGR02271 family)